MKIIPLSLPTNENIKVIGQLYASDDPSELSQDMLEIQIDDVSMYVGWYPEGDKDGMYRITLYHPDKEDISSYWPLNDIVDVIYLTVETILVAKDPSRDISDLIMQMVFFNIGDDV